MPFIRPFKAAYVVPLSFYQYYLVSINHFKMENMANFYGF